MKRHLIFGLIAAAIVSACGVHNLQGNDGSPFSTEGAGQGAASMFGQGAGVLKSLNLTSDQKTRIQTVMKAQRQATPKAGRESLQELKTVLLAPTVDGPRLSTLLRDTLAKQHSQMDSWVSVLSQVRDILTPEQRAKAAALPFGLGGAGHFGGSGRMTKLFDGLTLTAPQQAAVNDLKAEFDKRAGDRKAKRAHMAEALAAFANDGDQVALKAALSTMSADPPVDAMVRVATALDQSQRMAVVKRLGSMRHGMGGHHGQDGGGGHHGQDGGHGHWGQTATPGPV